MVIMTALGIHGDEMNFHMFILIFYALIAVGAAYGTLRSMVKERR
jgi:hypothetical protein